MILPIVVFLIVLVVIFIGYKLYKYTIKDVIPLNQMYLINLDRRTDRLSITHKNLKLYGFSNVKRFSAIDSSKFTAMQINEITNPKSRESIFKNYRTNDEQLSKGALGCYLSHLTLWKSMVENNQDKMIIFEDDTNPTITKEQIEQYVRKIPNNWDIILFGGWYLNGWKIDNSLYKIQRFFGLHAYMIRNTENVRKMIDNAMPISKQIDWYLTDNAKAEKLNIYGIMHSPMWGQNETINSTDIQIPIIK